MLEPSKKLNKLIEEYGTVTRIPTLNDVIEKALTEGSRFSGEAYQFVDEAMRGLSLKWTLDQVRTKHYEFEMPSERLVKALRELAAQKFGAQARGVFNSWGVASWPDFGEIVSQLQRAKIPDFSPVKFQKEDFRGQGIFDDIFPQR